ncbi:MULTISPECIES: gliding motility-associated ABC transporter permease subunit GldF [Pedobacter]|uniref:gliding motility-associated ABC transporter permease subunit GldF n=1 Tax=Pedobacter TaxID=84567 RepID=UPI00210BE2D8|nr:MULTISPECIES: gliding motility-associated ABC transporter permease subunit GldF [unclassified Pedobacter]
MRAVFKRELFSLLHSLMAYITIGVFLLALGLLLWLFPDTSILEYGYAELTGFFSLSPFLLMFLAPALTMRSFAEERKEGTYILLATRPLTDWQIIFGKYLACFVLLLFALVPTLVYFYSVHRLAMPEGNIDTGAVIGSYFGLILLGASFIAVGVFASAMTKNQAIAFAVSVFICFIAYSGLQAVSAVFALRHMENLLLSLSVNTHFESMSRGVLDTRDVVYFLSFILFFLGGTRVLLEGRKW